MRRSSLGRLLNRRECSISAAWLRFGPLPYIEYGTREAITFPVALFPDFRGFL
jgi:hypothetical protein